LYRIPIKYLQLANRYNYKNIAIEWQFAVRTHTKAVFFFQALIGNFETSVYLLSCTFGNIKIISTKIFTPKTVFIAHFILIKFCFIAGYSKSTFMVLVAHFFEHFSW
jgi:hypothetical protein